MSDPTRPERIMARMPEGSCPECYEAGTPERPRCVSHGHDLTTSGVTLCDPHEHFIRATPAPEPEGRYVGFEEQKARLAALSTTPAPLDGQEIDVEDEKTATTPDQDALDYAWTIIANAGGGDWTRETQDWQDAAARFRDQYHAPLDVRRRSTP